MGEALDTKTHRLYVARATAVEDTSLLDLTTAGNFASKPAGALDLAKRCVSNPLQISPVPAILKQNGIRFMICSNGDEDSTFAWYLKTWGNENWPCRYVATGTGAIGTQAVVTYPHNGVATGQVWADTLAVSWYSWPKGVVSTEETGRDSIADIWLDNAGSRYWLVEIDTSASGADGDTVYTVFYGYW